ncbi:T6SS immunity protein Tli3 family protein [Pantoea endophytica]|uniref:T6SS immunity protein Tli3 family protein n=1 Tax=Pantoea endophytica TaxID=92488 RepID=UPI0024135364|nr:hypothetical protein [Pantoea endophytica]
MNNISKLMFLLSCLTAIPLLSGCVTEGAVFGLGVGSLHETVMTEKVKNAPPPVYGPPQIIYRIDENRFFTLEDYTHCENGKTFYNNKKNNIHVQISPSSGYLFKGRLFWLSTRDDYQAFPLTLNDNKAACLGSGKGCLNIISVSVDGGKTKRSVTYGANTQDPNEDTADYDMLVTNDGFYMIDFKGHERYEEEARTWKWTFYPDEYSTKQNGYPGVTGPVYQKHLPLDDISKVEQIRLTCDKALVPVQ